MGFELSPAFVADQLEDDPPVLWQLHITGFAGFASSGASIEVARYCAEHRAATYNVSGTFHEMIDLQKWDGSDIFTIWPYPLIYIATSRFKTFICKQGLTGVKFLSVLEEELVGKASPGLPQQWLSPESVRRLLNDRDLLTVLNRVV
jgi:hypothetical protein